MVAEPQSHVHQPRVVALPRRYTVADYDRLPDDGPRYELIDGVLIEMPGASVRHQRIAGWIYSVMVALARADHLGEVFFAPLDVELSRHRVVQPDVLFVSTARRGIIREMRVVGAPDLVVEISSRSTRDRDLDTKRGFYREAGVREYWFVDVDEQTITVWVADDGDWRALAADDQGHAVSTVLPGLTVDPVALFADGR